MGKNWDSNIPNNTRYIYNVCCYLKSDSSQINYKLFQIRNIKNKKFLNGILSVTNNKKDFYHINIIYEMDSITGFSVRNKDFVEGYDFQKGNLNGDFSKYSPFLEISGRYDNGYRIGEWIEYHALGITKSRGTYIKKVISLDYNPKTKEIVEIQNFKDTLNVFPFENYYIIAKKYNIPKNENLIERFPKRINLKDGDWLYYDETEKLIRKEIYKDGIFETVIEY